MSKENLQVKNFHYVSMEDYKKDTSNLTDQSLSIIQIKDAEIERLQGLIGAILNQVGEIRFSFFMFDEPEKLSYEYFLDESTMEIILKKHKQ